MKQITTNVSETVYKGFQVLASQQHTTAAELIRRAMEDYLRQQIARRKSLLNLRSFSMLPKDPTFSRADLYEDLYQ